jgi:hypothetical protein
MAAGLVQKISAGVELYKQSKEQFIQIKRTGEEIIAIGKEAHGFWTQLLKFFGSKPKPQVAKPVAKSKKSDYVDVDETQVKIGIVQNLTEFFRLQEQLAEHIRSEELKSITVYDPNQNHMEAALKRVMAAQEMERLTVQIRECLVYNAPSEMGALYSSVYEIDRKSVV